MVENIYALVESGYGIIREIREIFDEKTYEDILPLWEVIVESATLQCGDCPYYKKSCMVSWVEMPKRRPALEQALRTLKTLQLKRISPAEAIALLNQIYISLLGCTEEIIRVEGLDE